MEVISAWELYLWTRLDAFHTAIGFDFLATMCILFGMVAFVACVVIPTDSGFSYEDSGDVKLLKAVKTGRNLLLIFGFGWHLLTMVIPTKQDAAVIFILPKIVNNQAIQQEAGEMYNIAKEALRELIPKPEVKEGK